MDDKLKTVLEAHDKLTTGMASIKDVKMLVDTILLAVRDLKKKLESDINDNKKETTSAYRYVMADMTRMEKSITEMMSNMYEGHEEEMDKKMAGIMSKVKEISDNMPEMPDMEEYESEMEKKIDDVKYLIPTSKEIKKEVMPEVNKKLEDLYDTLKEYIDSRPKTEVSSRPVIIGGRVGLQVFDDTSKVSTKINELSFGSGLAVSIVNGRVTVTGTGGGTGYTKATPTGDVNGSNTSYVVTNEPVYVIADGTTYFDGAGYTYSALTITMDNAPTQYIRYFY